jgi:DNA-nicking Smr family endonuclease
LDKNGRIRGSGYSANESHLPDGGMSFSNLGKEPTNQITLFIVEKMSDKQKINIPNKIQKYCIGPGGSIIKEIGAKTKCKINFTGDDAEIVGAMTDIPNAIHELYAVLGEIGWFWKNGKWVEETKQDELHVKYRLPAEKEVQLRNKLFDDAKKAFDEGKKDVAKQLSDQAKVHGANFEKLSEVAAKGIFTEMNKGRDDYTIDFHGLQVEEAAKFLNERLDKIKNNKKPLTVITGAGNHSVGHKCLIKPKAIEILKGRKLVFEESGNGQIIVKF